MPGNHEARSLAVFCDFENVALGVREARYSQFDMEKVLERLLAKGSIVVKKAYCDWERYKEFKATMHAAAFELIAMDERVENCLVETAEMRIRFVAPTERAQGLIERIYQDGGLRFSQRHRLDGGLLPV